LDDFFERAFKYLIDNEGTQFTNDPRDSGGATKFGVTQRAYERYLGHVVLSTDIKNMEIQTAKKFYFDLYWKGVGCDRLTNQAVAISIFDTGVLYGAFTSVRMAQKAASLCSGDVLELDGVLGQKTLTLINSLDENQFLMTFNKLIVQRIDAVILSSQKNEVYRRGWMRRANRLLTLTDIISVMGKV
jgi:lysozyme family protein